MSKTSDKLAAGVRKAKDEPAAPTAQSAETAPRRKPIPDHDPAYGLPAPTQGLHPARIWPD
ncbi:hypothetical protein [Thiobacter aerophilum]|uniref:Uncharacterized protein n=1 Tax=Thiobacter aerophilum TaxID=3121275 RepID=A0ABV0EK40_9BURK